jgi:hypothetical protein
MPIFSFLNIWTKIFNKGEHVRRELKSKLEVETESKVDVAPEPVKTTPNYTHKAYGLMRHPISQKWTVVGIGFDRDGNVSPTFEIDQQEDKEFAMERFRINVANEVFSKDK